MPAEEDEESVVVQLIGVMASMQQADQPGSNRRSPSMKSISTPHLGGHKRNPLSNTELIHLWPPRVAATVVRVLFANTSFRIINHGGCDWGIKAGKPCHFGCTGEVNTNSCRSQSPYWSFAIFSKCFNLEVSPQSWRVGRTLVAIIRQF